MLQTFVTCCLLASTSTATASPFFVRDQNPLLAGFAIPQAMPARIANTGDWQLAADLHWGSSSIVQTHASEALIVDAETHEVRLTLGRTVTDRVALQLQLPYRYTGPGNLDSFIDGWHDFFGLSEGARKDLPRDQIRIAYQRGTTAIDLRSSRSGIADISADIGYGLVDSEATSATAWLSVKLPTGDAEELTGSGATDVSFALAAEHRFDSRWSMFGQVAVSYLGEGDFLADRQRSVVWSGLAGAGVNVWRGLDLKIQLDAHSAVFDSELDFLSDTVVLTFGGNYRFDNGWQLDVGVSEDIVVDASPDVVFVLGFRRALGPTGKLASW